MTKVSYSERGCAPSMSPPTRSTSENYSEVFNSIPCNAYMNIQEQTAEARGKRQYP